MKLIKFFFLLIVYIIGIIDANAAPLDSLLIESYLSTWNKEDATPKVRLDAIQEFLYDNKYYRVNPFLSDTLSKEQLELAQEKGNNTDVFNAIINRCYALYKLRAYTQALAASEELFSPKFTNISNTHKGRAYNIAGLILKKINRTEDAMIAFNKVFELEDIDPTEIFRAHKYLGTVYSRAGNLLKAIDAFNTSYQFIENEEEKDFLKSTHYNNIAIAYYRMDNYIKAFENIKKSIYFLKKSGNETELRTKFNNLSAMYRETGKFEKAKLYIDTALMLAHKYKDQQYVIRQNTSLAYILIKQDSLQCAGDIITSIYKHLEDITDPNIEAHFHFVNGIYKSKIKEYRDAYSSCKKAYDINTKLNFFTKKERCVKCLFNASVHLSQPAVTSKWFDEYNAVKDSLNNKDVLTKISQLEYEQKNKEQILILKNKAKAEYKNKMTLWIILIALTCLALTLFWVYTAEKKKSNLLSKQNNLLEENLKIKTQIEEQSRKLQKQEQQKTIFLANIAHELQTPLMVISGQSKNLLANNDISQKDKLTINTIVKNSTSLSNLTKQIIETSKNKEWKTKLDLKKFYLYEILNPIISEYENLANEKNINLNYEFNDTQELSMITDANKLRVIITNIISNALRYAKLDGNISINCHDDNGNLSIKIEDDGIGISKHDLTSIFDRFYQVTQSSKFEIQAGGFGMGLSICKQYTELLGGTIWAKSNIGVGSAFYISIPQHLDDPKNIQKTLGNDALNVLPVDIPNKIFQCETAPSILIVEDNKDIWSLIQNLLFEKYNLHFTSNGLEALKYLEKNPTPNLIITDLMMPHMDGLSFIERVKSDINLNFIPLLVLSARNDIRDQISELSLNMDAFLLKPFNNDIFKTRVEYLLELSKYRFTDIIAQNKTHFSLTEKEQDWLSEVGNLVSDSLQDHNLKPKDIADQMNLSQVHLDRKLKSLIGFTTSKYILEARLRISLDLIEKKEYNLVKEICYQVGFKSPKSFSRSFKQRFGTYPSEMLN